MSDLNEAGLSAAEAALINMGQTQHWTTTVGEAARLVLESYFEHAEVDTKRRLHPTDPSAHIEGTTRKFWVGGVEGYITTNCFPDGNLGEMFIHGIGKEGSTTAGFVDLAAILFSVALQYGVPMEQMTKFMKGMTFEPKDEEYSSIPDFIARYLDKKYGGGSNA